MNDPTWISVLPPVLAIVLAIWSRQVYLSLAGGLWLGWTILSGKSEAEPLAPDAPPAIAGMVGGATLNYAQALGNFKAALEGSASPEAMKALEASPQAKDPAAASRVAVIAMAAHKPLATVAYAIKAHETAPGEPLWLSNLASIANYYGLPREALAFAQKAETLPNKLPAFQQGILLSNKGQALNSLGRPQEAQAALAEAIRLAPNLSEAYTNIAYALSDQDKCDQAVRYLRAGTTRRPAQVFDSTLETSDAPTRVPLSQVLDLSKGKVGVLPNVPYPTGPEDADAINKHLKSLDALTRPADQRYGEQAQQMILAAQARRAQWAEQGLAGTLSANFADALVNALQEYTQEIITFHQIWLGGAEQGFHPDPDLRNPAKTVVQASYSMTKSIMASDETWSSRYAAIVHEYDQAMPRCEKSRDQSTCESLASLKKDTKICVLGKELGAKLMVPAQAYDRALRELYAESYRRASAVAAYFGDPAHKAWSKLVLEYYTAATFSRLVGGSALVAKMFESVTASCKAANRTPMDILFARLKQMADECHPSGPAPKASVGVLSISADCEKIGIGVSTPGEVGLFTDVEYKFSQRYRRLKDGKERFLEKQAGRDPDIALKLPGYGDAFDGELTVFAGGQAKVSAGRGSAEAGVKAGGYTTFNGHGDIVDSGGKFSVSGSGQTGAGGIGAGVDSGIVSGIASRHTPGD